MAYTAKRATGQSEVIWDIYDGTTHVLVVTFEANPPSQQDEPWTCVFNLPGNTGPTYGKAGFTKLGGYQAAQSGAVEDEVPIGVIWSDLLRALTSAGAFL